MNTVYVLKAEFLHDREEAHEYLAKTLALPLYYGKNLDALADCLGELGEDVTVILDDAEQLRESDGYGAAVLSVLEHCADEGAFTLICGGLSD